MLYTPRTTSLDDVCAIPASGKNVVTTAFLFHPPRIYPADRDQLLTACKAGGLVVLRQPGATTDTRYGVPLAPG